MAVLRLLQAIFGPTVYRFYNEGGALLGRPYHPNKVEDYSNKVLLFGYFAFHLIGHLFPVYAVYYVLRRGFPTATGVMDTLVQCAFVPAILSCVYIVRGCGRYANPDYHVYLDAHNRARQITGTFTHQQALSTGLAGIDFDFYHHPVMFHHGDSTVKPRVLSSERPRSVSENLIRAPYSLLKYIGANVVGRRLIYPGSIAPLQMAMEGFLSEGRAKLIKMHRGKRAKLLAPDGNHIDAMFVDRRDGGRSGNGQKLVICCEGNAAFYELSGAMAPPMEAGYSVLGWNHPGFAGSSGLPFPSQEANAIDVVVRYAVTELGFTFGDIVLYSWSIGGFAASWAAMSYPEISAVILDATFDKLEPLACSRMPDWLKGLTTDMVNDHFALDIAEQLSFYPGPLHLIRRVNDEMITTRVNDPTTNRINYLLVKLLQCRYPQLFTRDSMQCLWLWIYSFNPGDRAALLAEKAVDQAWCRATLLTNRAGESYPSAIGNALNNDQKTRMLLYLADRYMEDFNTTHCTPLPVSYFKIPSQE